MTNTVKSFEAQQKMNTTIREREEKNIQHGYKAIGISKDGKLWELVDLRIGQTATTAYACVWLHVAGYGTYAHGSGKAGGYGYHRSSAAAESAFRSAGMIFNQSFSGCGDTMTREAVQAAGEYLSNGVPVYVVEFYG